MRRAWPARLLALGALALWLASPALQAQELVAALGEQVLMLPASGFTEPALELTVYRPPGQGPFPVLLINHGRAPGNAHLQPRYRPVLAAARRSTAAATWPATG